MTEPTRADPRPPGTRPSAEEGGYALAGVLLILVVLTSLAVASWQSTRDESLAGAAMRRSAKAFYAAEAGLHQVHADWDYDATYSDLTDPGDSLTTGWTTIGENGARFRTVVRRVNDYNLRTHLYTVTSYGESPAPRRARRTLTDMLKMELSAPLAAMAVNGDFDITGQPDFHGECANIHANGTLDFTGGLAEAPSGTIVSSAETIVASSNAQDYDGNELPTRDSVPQQEFTEYDPWSFCSGEVDYWLRTHGSSSHWLVDVTGSTADSMEMESSSDDELETYGWKWDDTDGKYVTIQGDVNEGVYCADDDVEIDDDLGSASNPTPLTLLVKNGSINLAGNPWLRPADGDSAITFMAEGDMHLSGNTDAGDPNTFEGILYSGAQCSIGGNPIIAGYLSCASTANPAGSIDWVSTNVIDGNPDITYTCGGFDRDTDADPLSSRSWFQRLD